MLLNEKKQFYTDTITQSKLHIVVVLLSANICIDSYCQLRTTITLPTQWNCTTSKMIKYVMCGFYGNTTVQRKKKDPKKDDKFLLSNEWVLDRRWEIKQFFLFCYLKHKHSVSREIKLWCDSKGLDGDGYVCFVLIQALFFNSDQ